MDRKNRVKRFSKIYYGKKSKKRSPAALAVIYSFVFLFVATASYFVSMAINSYCRRPHCTKIEPLPEVVYDRSFEGKVNNYEKVNSNEQNNNKTTRTLVDDEKEASDSLSVPSNTISKINGVEVDLKTLASGAAFEKFLKRVKADDKNAVVVCLKGEDGKLPFESSLELAQKWKTTAPKKAIDFEEVARKIKDEGMIPIARMSAFFDQTAASVENENTFLYEKGSSGSKSVAHVFGGSGVVKKGKWLDATNSDVRKYVAGLAVEIAKMGFENILIDNAWFPVFKSKYEINNFEEGAYDADVRFRALLMFVNDLNSSGVKAIFSYPGDVLFKPDLAKSLFGKPNLLDNFKYHAPIYSNVSGIEKSGVVFNRLSSKFVFVPVFYSNSKNIGNMFDKLSAYEIESNFIVRNC